jgi:hypothetical protein
VELFIAAFRFSWHAVRMDADASRADRDVRRKRLFATAAAFSHATRTIARPAETARVRTREQISILLAGNQERPRAVGCFVRSNLGCMRNYVAHLFGPEVTRSGQMQPGSCRFKPLRKRRVESSRIRGKSAVLWQKKDYSRIHSNLHLLSPFLRFLSLFCHGFFSVSSRPLAATPDVLFSLGSCAERCCRKSPRTSVALTHPPSLRFPRL